MHENPFSHYLHVHFWAGFCPRVLWCHRPFLKITSHGKGMQKATSEAALKDVPLFRSGTSVLFWDSNFRLSQNDRSQITGDVD